MEVKTVSIDEIFPYGKNPRRNDKAVNLVANSLKEFGWQQPIVVGKDGIIIAGHTRYKAAIKLKMKQVPVVVADSLTDEQVKAYRLADNKTGEAATWEPDLLMEELAEILDIDMNAFGFKDLEQEQTDSKYIQKTDVPHYEITGAEPAIADLVNLDKYKSLMNSIEESSVTDEQKTFLRMAATRHLAFNYKNVAEYYAHQNEEMQELMEQSALVIIDYDDAMKYGYIELSEALEDIIGHD